MFVYIKRDFLLNFRFLNRVTFKKILLKPKYRKFSSKFKQLGSGNKYKKYFHNSINLFAASRDWPGISY